MTARAALEALGLGFFSIGVGLATDDHLCGLCGPRDQPQAGGDRHRRGRYPISLLAGFAVFPSCSPIVSIPPSGPGLRVRDAAARLRRLPVRRRSRPSRSSSCCCGGDRRRSRCSICRSRSPAAPWDGRDRARASLPPGTCFVAGTASVSLVQYLVRLASASAFDFFAQATIFDLLDELTSNIMPALWVVSPWRSSAGWALPQQILDQGIVGLAANKLSALRRLLRYVVPHWRSPTGSPKLLLFF